MNATAARFGRPVQIAYFVNDIVDAAGRMSELFGAGPFHVIERIELAWGIHHGQPCPFVHSSAYGQWGELMLELVQQDEAGPSPFRDMYDVGEEGLHHVAHFVDDLDQALERAKNAGWPLAARAMTRSGVEFAFVDASPSLGHMLELYEPRDELRDFYRHVRQTAADWDGTDPVRWLQGRSSKTI
jgi:catechol 2,3-dioxygenase-like lactoylglutathione lyase family enzyme